MILRCREGDMAIVLDPLHQAYGCLVDVKEFLGNITPHCVKTGKDRRLINAWHIDHERLPITSIWVCQDRHLLPIRPGDLDEIEETENDRQAHILES